MYSAIVVGGEDTWQETAGIREMGEGGIPTQRAGGAPRFQQMHCIPALSHFTNTTKTACTSGKVNNHATQILLDSGTSCSVMQTDHTLQTNLINSYSITLINADGSKLTPLGTTMVTLDLESMVVEHTLIVCSSKNCQHLLSLDVTF